MNRERDRKWYALAILNVLMNSDDYLTTSQIIHKVGCERKSVYHAMAILEVNGFGIDVKDAGNRKGNKYKYIGLYGL